MKRLFYFSLVTAMVSLLHADDHTAAPNQLTDAEEAAGWVLLFNGKTLDGWRNYRGDANIADGWTVEDGNLKKVRGKRGGNIITEKKFRDFELSWEWNVEPRGNNGIKYFVIEERPSAPGHEYQLLDDNGHPDARAGKDRQTASFYEVFAPADDKPLNPPGQWNHSKIVVNGMNVQHWLNGSLVLEYELGSDATKAGIQDSKFRNERDFGKKVDGHIMLTDHEDQCLFRNIKLRELNPAE